MTSEVLSLAPYSSAVNNLPVYLLNNLPNFIQEPESAETALARNRPDLASEVLKKYHEDATIAFANGSGLRLSSDYVNNLSPNRRAQIDSINVRTRRTRPSGFFAFFSLDEIERIEMDFEVSFART